MNIEEKVAPHIRQMPPSGIRKFFDIVSEMKDSISLSVGEPDFTTPWNISESAIYAIEHGHTHYSSNAGILELREMICQYYRQRYEVCYEPSDCIVTVGASEAIDLALRALIEPGDEVIVPAPSYVSYSPGVMMCGGVPVAAPTKAEHACKITPETIESLITPKTKAIIIPYPNNPTGAILTRNELESIAQVLEKTEILVISDEIYSELTYGRRHVSIASIPASSMSQYAGMEALRQGLEDNFASVEKMVREYDRRRRYVLSRLRGMGLPCFEPEGAFYAFPEIKQTGMTSEDFCTRLLREKGVAVVPGPAFGESGEGYVRLSYATAMDQIKIAMDRMEEFLHSIESIR